MTDGPIADHYRDSLLKNLERFLSVSRDPFCYVEISFREAKQGIRKSKKVMYDV